MPNSGLMTWRGLKNILPSGKPLPRSLCWRMRANLWTEVRPLDMLLKSTLLSNRVDPETWLQGSYFDPKRSYYFYLFIGTSAEASMKILFFAKLHGRRLNGISIPLHPFSLSWEESAGEGATYLQPAYSSMPSRLMSSGVGLPSSSHPLTR